MLVDRAHLLTLTDGMARNQGQLVIHYKRDIEAVPVNACRKLSDLRLAMLASLATSLPHAPRRYILDSEPDRIKVRAGKRSR
ncbi:MAG: hypothetical protein DI605_10950 [Sphingomonas sp.]|nr:MAG: hypothetical protein DI605_10950 [Sphingomonas sp.]